MRCGPVSLLMEVVLLTGKIPEFSGGRTLAQSIMEEKAGGAGGFDIASINVLGGLSAVSLSRDGSGLTNVLATAVGFPQIIETTLQGGDKFFINDGSTSVNKNTSYFQVITSLSVGTGIKVETATVDGVAKLGMGVEGAAALNPGTITRWDGSGFADSIMTQTALGNIRIAGGATITGNLSVQGDVT